MQSAICFVSFTVLFFLGRPAAFNCLIHLLRLNQLIVEPFLENVKMWLIQGRGNKTNNVSKWISHAKLASTCKQWLDYNHVGTFSVHDVIV